MCRTFPTGNGGAGRHVVRESCFNVEVQRAPKASAAMTGYADRRLSKHRWPQHGEAAEVESRRRLRLARLMD
jgi:hypothetical protein